MERLEEVHRATLVDQPWQPLRGAVVAERRMIAATVVDAVPVSNHRSSAHASGPAAPAHVAHGGVRNAGTRAGDLRPARPALERRTRGSSRGRQSLGRPRRSWRASPCRSRRSSAVRVGGRPRAGPRPQCSRRDGPAPGALSGPAPQEDPAMPPTKLAHVVFQTNRMAEMRDWYCAVLGGHVIYENPHLCFVTYDDEHHRVAFVDFGPLTPRDRGREASWA